MSEREAKLYWVKKVGGKDILIFDRGYKGGTLYVYEFKESFLVDDIQKTEKDIRSWIEKKFGTPTDAWKLEQSFG
jgi:hypothetical protein